MNFKKAHAPVHGAIVTTLITSDENGNRISEVVIDEGFYSAKHWIEKLQNGVVTLQTFDEIIKADGLGRYIRPEDRIVKPDADERYRKTVEWERRWYDALSRGEQWTMIKPDEIIKQGAR